MPATIEPFLIKSGKISLSKEHLILNLFEFCFITSGSMRYTPPLDNFEYFLFDLTIFFTKNFLFIQT